MNTMVAGFPLPQLLRSNLSIITLDVHHSYLVSSPSPKLTIIWKLGDCGLQTAIRNMLYDGSRSTSICVSHYSVIGLCRSSAYALFKAIVD